MEPSDVDPQPNTPDATAGIPYLPEPSRHPKPPTGALPPPPPPPSPWQSAGMPGMYGDSAPRPANLYVPAPWWKRAIAPLLVVLVIGGIVAVVLRANPSSTSGHPDEWDSRVESIAAFVSDTRELEWTHPVYVDFLPEAEFVALFDEPQQSRSTLAGLDDLARLQAEKESAVYNAKGLAVSYNPADAEATVQAVTTLGFYSPGTDRIYVRGNDLTPAVRVVLAHELTHALQGQHFDLNAERPNDLEFRAIVEADALRVENVYRDTLSTAEQEQADSGNTLTEEAQTELDGVPWALVDQSYAPYVLGPNLVNDVYADDGNAGVDRLISAPPTEEILLNPWLFGTDQPRPTVILTAPPGSITIDETQQLSPVEMLIMLDAWLPFGQARAALDGWGNGSSVSYTSSAGEVCYAAKVVFDDGVSAARFRDAVVAWGEAMAPGLFPSLKEESVEFESCYRGANARSTPNPIISPMFALTVEHEAITLAGDDPTPEQIAGYQCFAATVIDDSEGAPLLATQEEFTAEQDATFDRVTDAAAAACGVPPLER